MRLTNKQSGIVICVFLFILSLYLPLWAQDTAGFKYEVNANSINIRSDSTTSAQIICMVNKGDSVYLVRESYGWYKIRLPSSAPAFISKSLVTIIDNSSARVAKDKVNVRLTPNTSSAIIGKLNIDTVVKVLEDQGEWYRIEPTDNCYGWINKKFVNKVMQFAQTPAQQPQAPPQQPPQAQAATQPQVLPPPPVAPAEQVFEGKIRPYGIFFIKRPATHKLITAEKKIILLKGEKDKLKALEYHQVRVTGKIVSEPKNGYPLLEISKAEALD